MRLLHRLGSALMAASIPRRSTMADTKQDAKQQDAKQAVFRVPEEMRTMAEKSLEQTRQALESFMGAARRTAETMEQTTDTARAGVKDMAQRTFSSAEQNIRAALDYAERLVRAKDLPEVTQIQSEFVRSQIETMQTQMKEFGSAAQSAMGQATDQAASAAQSATDQAASGTTRGKGGKS
jgi:phasin